MLTGDLIDWNVERRVSLTTQGFTDVRRTAAGVDEMLSKNGLNTMLM